MILHHVALDQVLVFGLVFFFFLWHVMLCYSISPGLPQSGKSQGKTYYFQGQGILPQVRKY